MRLEDLTVALRPRGSWEAVDLGCSLVRRDYGRLLGLWAITVLPLWAILAAFLWRWPTIFGLVVWWLKPLYDRVPLFFLSRAAFGVRPRISETLRAWPGLWMRFLFSALILRRFSFIRSFALPVWMLEGQRGAAVRTRVKALATDVGSSAIGTSWVFLKLEFAVFLGLWVATSFVAPESGSPDFGEFFSSIFDDSALAASTDTAFEWYLMGLYMVALSLVEMFYVGAGFGLYLNSRIKLEGWDIELTFRKLAARLRPAAATAAAALFLLLAGLPSLAHAKSTSPLPSNTAGESAQASADPATEAIRDILSQPDFEVHKKKQKVPVNKSYSGPSGSAGGIGGIINAVLTIIAWAIAAAVVGLLVWWLVANRHLFRFSGRMSRPLAQPQKPRVVMGMNIAPESLPTHIVDAARAAWQEGRLREALSLLYRGALSHLVEQQRLPIRDSDTEDDCLIHVAKSGERSISDYFRSLTMLWVRAAYAGIEAGADEFDHLCRTWPFNQATPAARSRSVRAVTPATTALLALACLLISSCEYEEKEITIGYKGKARTDPFLAAQRLLGEFGYEAERLNVLKKLPEDPSDHVLVLSGEGGMSEGRARQLLSWVESGGHLVYALAGCRPYNDWGFFASASNYAYFGNDEREDPLLEELDILPQDRRIKESEDAEKNNKDAEKNGNAKKVAKKEVKDADQAAKDIGEAAKKEEKPTADKKKEDIPSELPITSAADVSTLTHKVKWNDESYELELPNYVTLKLDRKLRSGEFSAGPLDEAAILGLRRGLGRITIVNHIRPLRSRYLGDHDHARWLVDLAGEDAMEVAFVLSLEGNFWTMLWSKAWMFLVGLALLVLLWLWRHLPRFGPVQHVELHETKHFSEHVSALGQFFHSLRRDDILLTAAADAVRARALRLFPQLHAGGDTALIPLLSERSSLPHERVKTALAPAASHPPHQLVRILHDLQTLRQSLG